MQANDLASELSSLWNFGDPAESEQRFRNLLDRVQGDSEAEAVIRAVVSDCITKGLMPPPPLRYNENTETWQPLGN